MAPPPVVAAAPTDDHRARPEPIPGLRTASATRTESDALVRFALAVDPALKLGAAYTARSEAALGVSARVVSPARTALGEAELCAFAATVTAAYTALVGAAGDAFAPALKPAALV